MRSPVLSPAGHVIKNVRMMATSNLFVYGSLRPGGALAHLIRPAVQAMREDVKISGNLYHAPFSTDKYPSYPVARFNENGTIIGTIYQVDTTLPTYQYVVMMELESGYDLVELTLNNGLTIQAFHYPGHVGLLVPHGDWNEVIRQADKRRENV